jgi:hypothetical protein
MIQIAVVDKMKVFKRYDVYEVCSTQPSAKTKGGLRCQIKSKKCNISYPLLPLTKLITQQKICVTNVSEPTQ